MPQINANLTLNTAQAQATFNQFVRTINSSRIGQPLGRISGDAAEFNKSMQAATARVTAFGLSAGAIIQVKNAIIGAANATIEVDKQLIELNTFLGQSTSELGKFSKSLFQVAKNTAAPFSEAAGAAKEFARQGLSANEVLERTESALTLARISGLDFKDSVQGITTAINSFGKEALKATEITNKLIAVDTRFAVSSADLNEAIRRVGSSAEESGVGIDSLIAAVTAAQQTTGRGGAVIGNALKTIFTRLQRPEVLTQLEQLGVAVKDQNGFLLDGIGILKNFSDATKNLSQAERSRTAELIGGVYQINQLNALIKDLSSSNSVYANSLRISNLATDEATKKNEELNKSMSSMLQSIKTTATEVASSFGSSFLRPVVEIGATLSESLLNKMNPSEVGSKLGSELIKGLGGALGEGLSRTALPILGAIGGLLAIKMGSFGKTAFKELGKASGDIFANQKDLELQKRINDVIGRNPSLITAIIAGKKTQAQAEAQILDFILKQNQQLRMQSSLSQRTFSNVTQGQKATPRKKIFGIFADGYLPNFAMSAEQQEVATAKAYGAKNPVPRVIQATIKGKTQRVMVNSEEDVIPNFAGTGDTAIIPRYRKMQDIPRMSPGYIPNFANFDFLKNNQSEFYSSRGSKYILQKAIALAQKTPGGKISLKSFIDQFQEFSEHPFESYPSQRHGFNSEMLKDPTNWKGPSPIGFRGASLDEILAIRSGKKFISDGRNNYGERKNITHFAPTPKNAFGDYGRRTGYAYTVAAAPLAKRTSIFAADTNTAYNYAANDVTKSDVLKTFKITGDELQILDDSSFASGYVPNFAFSSMKSPASEDRKFVDPETYSYLRYKLSNDKKAIDLKFSKSEMKGQGWQMFERLGKTARRMGLPVRSSNLSSQANDVYDITDASLARAGKYGIEEVLKVGYPQLIHRQKGSSKNTTLSLNIDDGLGHKNKELSGKDIFSVVSDFASKKYKGDAKLFRNSILDGSFDISNVETNFAGGRIPNFAKRIDVIERIGKEEIFARFQKHFEAGKDYQGFYNIHGEEFGGKKLSPQEAKIYANITSAISPSVPDYVAAQFAAPIFNRYMKTKSTNVEDYFDLAPSKKVSRHKNVFGLGLFGLKGTISKQGNIRTRDDVRRSGLSKALRGLDLGSDDTAKTRHYARAILQDKTAFPIDTNVIQAILGGKTPSKTEAAKLISLANEFATLNKIETGAAGLQAAIFKSNSKHSEKYSPDTVRSALSGIQGRSGGYVPNFAKILIAAKYYDGLKVGRAKGVNISKTGDIQNVGREVFGGIGFSTSRIGKGYASAVRTTSPTTSLKKASEQAGVTKSIIIPVVASSAVNDPVPENLKTNEALLQQFLANHPQPKEIVASLSQQGFNVKSILNSHSGSEIKSIIDILSSDLFNKKILVKSANELKDPRLVKFFAPGGVKARGPKGTYAFGSSIASMQQGEYASKIPGKHKSYPILVTGKSGPEISEPINAEEIFPGITDNKNRLFFSSVYQFGTRTLDTDNPEHMELLGRLGYSQKRLRQENLMAQGYVPNFASTFNAEKIKKMGGFVGQANKASAPGLYNILNRIGIPIDLDNITKKGLTDALSSKENKLKLYNFLKQEPIEITNYPDSYSEVKDGNHRFTLAQFAGIKNIPAKYKDNFSGGYIPNFSGLSDAVSREKTMSGLPASQIMAHFDRGGNPIAVTNKRDEPNGLKDVPNFAIPRSLLRLLSTRRSGLINPVTGGAEQFVGNIVIGILNQLAENEKVSTDIAAGATAGIPIGFGIKNILKAATSKRGSKGEKIAAGLTGLGQLGFGALSGFSAKTELEKRLNEKKYSEALDRSRTSFQNLTENTAELADTFAKLDSAYRDPQADPRTITKLAKKQEDLLNKITFKNPDLVAKLASESDLGKKQAIIEESTKEGQRIQSIREESLKFLSRGSISGKDAPEKISDFFASIINSGNPELLNQNLSGAQPSDFANILKKGGLDVEEFSKIFQTDDLKKSFIEGLIVTQKLTQLSNEQASVVRELSKPLTEKKQNIQDTRAVRLAVSASLKEQLPELASFAGGFSRRAGISAASEAELAITRSEASVAFNNSLMSELANSKFSDGLPSSVRDRLLAIQSPSIQTGKELESLKALPGLSKEQIAGIDKLIGFNSQQNRKLETANKVANETKNVQLKFLALQEKLAFGGDIRSSIDPEARAEAMSSAIRGPLTYQLGGLLGSRRTQIGGATDFLTDTIKKYPGLLQTKDGKEPADIQAVKRELTGLNAMDMQRDLLKRASMAEMMGLGQTGSMLRSKAFDRNYLLESAGLKTSALFSSPEVPEEVKKAMEGYEKFNVEGVRQFKGEERDLKNLEDQIAPIKQAITNKLTAEGSELAKAFKASLTQTFGEKGITADLVNVFGKKIDEEAINKNVDNIAKAYAGQAGLMPKPAGIPSNANGLTKYSSSIADAVKREKTALASRGIMGVPNFAMASINLERSPDLVNASNPFGFGVTNSIDEKNGLRSLGMRSSGFVPNYALPSFMSASNLDKARSVLTNADDAQSLLGNIKEGNIGGAAMDLAGPALDAAKFAAKNVAKKAGLGAAGIGLDIGEYIVKPLSEKLGVTDYLADKMYNALYAKPEKSNIARASDAYNSRLGNDLIDPSPEYMKKAKVPNFAKSSNIDPLLERIYGPKAGATKTPKAVKTPPASIQGVSASTMPFYPEGAMERTYPRGPRLSISNVNPYGRVLTKAERAAAGELIPGASRNPFTGQFMSKKDIDLVQAIKAGKEAKAATLAQRKALIEIEKATRPAGPNPIFAQTARESGLAQIGAARYAERQGSLSRLASPIFDPALDPAKKMSAQELQNRLKITTERPASPNSINAQKQRLAEALKAETLKQAEQNRRQNLANRYFERTAPQRAEMKAFSEAQQARLAKEAADKIRSGQRIDLSNIIRGYGTTAFAKGRSADLRGVISKLNLDAYGASNFKQYTPEEVNKILASKKPTQPAATSGLLGSIAKSMPTSGIAGRAVRAGAFGLKGLGIAGAAGFGITQGLEAYVAAKEGEYGKATLAGLSSAASFAALSKSAGRVAGPAGVALAGLTDLDLKTLTLASDWKDIFGRKGEEESIGLGDIAGTGLAAITALPAVVGLLGYRTGNILENKLGLGTKLGDLAAGSMTARASYEAGIRPKGGMTVNEAVKANQLVAKKSELVGQINKLNQISGNPLISRDFQISASRRGQEAAAEKEIEDLKKKLDEESIAAKAAMAGRVSGKVKEEMARLDKESEARDEGQRSKLRKTFLESFEKNAEANGFLTTSDRVNYLLSQEGKNGLGSFKPTDFKDAEFARSFNIYKTAREAQAAREANQVIPASTIEFRNRPIPSFPQDVLEEATRTGRSAEKVIADREEAALRRGAASQGITTPEINTQMSRDYTAATGLQDFPKDVLEEAARRRVTAEQVMQERASGIVPNFAAMSNSMMSSGDVYSRMRMSAPRMSFPSAAQGSVPNFAIGEFSDAITEAMRNGITSAFPNGASSSNVSNSNVINIDGRTSIQNAPDEAMQGIISILFDKIPELKKLGPAALNFKR